MQNCVFSDPRRGSHCFLWMSLFVQDSGTIFVFLVLFTAVVNVTEDTVKQSRRLMIILEPELSSCSRLEETSEQQIAVYNALVNCGIKVILIEMEKIKNYTSMPESIQYIKQKHGAIRWKEDSAETSQLANSRFWKNVRYQMPPRRTLSLSEIHLLPQFHSNPVMTIAR